MTNPNLSPLPKSGEPPVSELQDALALWDINQRPTWVQPIVDAARRVANPELIDIVFDGPPSHESGRFVEVENQDGHSISVGEWIERDDGYWVLRLPLGVNTKDDDG